MTNPHVVGAGFVLFLKICLALVIGASLASSGHEVLGGMLIGGALLLVIIALGIISLVT